jgi:hypothetical protein
MIDIGPTGSLSIYLSTNAFKVQDMSVAGATVFPAPCGNLTLTGLGATPLTIPVYSLGLLSSPGLSLQVWSIPDILTAALTITSYWTYDGLYDATTGAWDG